MNMQKRNIKESPNLNLYHSQEFEGKVKRRNAVQADSGTQKHCQASGLKLYKEIPEMARLHLVAVYINKLIRMNI